ncbi:hypothetical protein POM88_008734 [Heracleum sosnowskyi]|uniref:F-box domain-containing protein n=1 Tax=Heracleum sosnowskyi TaxID=360622 RepID=A0AAD8J801_9APIA|nr:hypothetical protein POM88_008734 [Heracleum sosnowskyi]
MANKTISDLPEGMVSEILVRLPVKTLLICKSVCKPWLSMISNPHFVKSQLRRAIIASMNTPTLLTIENPPPTAEELAFKMKAIEMEKNFVTYTAPAYERLQERRRELVKQAVLDAKDQDLSSCPVQFDRLVVPRPFFPYGVVSCCNGIICLATGFGKTVCLWNPSIRKCKKLPHPQPYTSRKYPVKMGFGYDSISDAYKVFRVVSEKLYDKVPIVQVYSTTTDSWREFRDPILKNYDNFRRINILVNGVLYFDGVEELIAFDMHSEVFRIVPFPSFCHRKRSDLLEFQGSVAMVFQTESGFDLWTLDDVVTGKVSWTKRFGIAVDSETELCLAKYLGGGQFFGQKLLLDKNIMLYNVLYNYQKKETRFYKLPEEKIFAYLKYTETLVSLDGFEPVDDTPTGFEHVDETPTESVSEKKG